MYISLVRWLIAYLVLCSECILMLCTATFDVYDESWTWIMFVLNWVVVVIIIQYTFLVLQHGKNETQNGILTIRSHADHDISRDSIDDIDFGQKSISNKNFEKSAKCAWLTSILTNTCSLYVLITGPILCPTILYLLSLCVYHHNYNCSNNDKMKNSVCMCSMYGWSFWCIFVNKIVTWAVFCVFLLIGGLDLIEFVALDQVVFIMLYMIVLFFAIWNYIFIANYYHLYHQRLIIASINQTSVTDVDLTINDDHADIDSNATTNSMSISGNVVMNKIQSWIGNKWFSKLYLHSQIIIFGVNAFLTIVFASISLIIEVFFNHTTNYCTVHMPIGVNTPWGCFIKIATIGIGVIILFIIFMRWVTNKFHGKIAWSLNDLYFRGTVFVKVIFFMIKPALIMESNSDDKLDYVFELSFQILMFFTTTALAIATYNRRFKNLEILQPIMPNAEKFARIYIAIYIICICSTYSILIYIILFKLYHYDSNWTTIIYPQFGWIIVIKLYLNEISQLINFHLRSQKDIMEMTHNRTSQQELLNAIKEFGY